MHLYDGSAVASMVEEDAFLDKASLVTSKPERAESLGGPVFANEIWGAMKEFIQRKITGIFRLNFIKHMRPF